MVSLLAWYGKEVRQGWVRLGGLCALVSFLRGNARRAADAGCA